jgi:hydrogenase maturation factor
VLEINLVMLPDVEVGDHVLVHSGYAVRTVQGSVRDDAVKFPSSGLGGPE